jgi:uncharacterized protein YgiM (DUF1202 family)
MFKYHQPSAPSSLPGGASASSSSVSGNEWSVSCHFSPASEEKDIKDQPPQPRLRWTGEEEDLSLPSALRRKEAAETPRPAPRRPLWPSVLILTAGPAALAGIMLFLADGAAVFSAGGVASDAISVETTSIKPGPVDLATLPATAPAESTRPAAGPVSRDQIDSGRFNDRFEAAKWVDATGNKLREKIQDRMKQDLQAAPDGNPVNTELRPYAQNGALLGYADSTRKSNEGQTAIKQMSADPDRQTARTATRTEYAAVMPDVDPSEASAEETDRAASVTANVNLRKSDQKDAEVLAVIPESAKIAVGSCDKWWCEVQYAGKSGFVGVKFVDTGN